MSERELIHQGAPTLAGLKTGSLFSCACDSWPLLLQEVRSWNRRLNHKGMMLLPLRKNGDRALLYLFRPQALAKDLAMPELAAFLRQAGYSDLRPSACLIELRSRLQTAGTFPHEIGLFLSYPIEDVKGFITHRGQNYKCSGCWKVYGDTNAAKRRFRQFQMCTDAYLRRYDRGCPIEALVVGEKSKTQERMHLS
ncbi:MAG: DUF3793 family protein [Oscillospiraceae bacterium]|nr:DUF3793 family protein [Oscillospiraceae bacterium]